MWGIRGKPALKLSQEGKHYCVKHRRMSWDCKAPPPTGASFLGPALLLLKCAVSARCERTQWLWQLTLRRGCMQFGTAHPAGTPCPAPSWQWHFLTSSALGVCPSFSINQTSAQDSSSSLNTAQASQKVGKPHQQLFSLFTISCLYSTFSEESWTRLRPPDVTAVCGVPGKPTTTSAEVLDGAVVHPNLWPMWSNGIWGQCTYRYMLWALKYA